MKDKRFHLVLVVAIIVLVLPGCTLRASTPPAATPTASTGGFPIPGTETMGLFETIATQTAMAQNTANLPVVPGNTQPTQAAATQEPSAAQPTAETAATQAPAAQATAKPTKAPLVTAPPPTPGLPASYTLQKGEFPFCIARRFNVNPGELLSINNLSLNSVVQPGTTLKIPQTGKTFPDGRQLHKHPVSYTVKAGDTIYSIGCYFGDVDPLVIASVNGLEAPYKLTAGQSLNIP